MSAIKQAVLPRVTAERTACLIRQRPSTEVARFSSSAATWPLRKPVQTRGAVKVLAPWRGLLPELGLSASTVTPAAADQAPLDASADARAVLALLVARQLPKMIASEDCNAGCQHRQPECVSVKDPHLPRARFGMWHIFQSA